MQGVFSLSPQRHAPSSLSQTPFLTPMGHDREELNIIWEPANQLPLFPTAQHDSIATIPQYLEQVNAKNRTRFLLQELNACRLKRDVARQLNKLTPSLSEGQLEQLEGLPTRESDFLTMEPCTRRICA